MVAKCGGCSEKGQDRNLYLGLHRRCCGPAHIPSARGLIPRAAGNLGGRLLSGAILQELPLAGGSCSTQDKAPPQGQLTSSDSPLQGTRAGPPDYFGITLKSQPRSRDPGHPLRPQLPAVPLSGGTCSLECCFHERFSGSFLPAILHLRVCVWGPGPETGMVREWCWINGVETEPEDGVSRGLRKEERGEEEQGWGRKGQKTKP